MRISELFVEYYKKSRNPEHATMIKKYYLRALIYFLQHDPHIHKIKQFEMEQYLLFIRDTRGKVSAFWNYNLFSKLFGYAFQKGYLKKSIFAYLKMRNPSYYKKTIHPPESIIRAINLIGAYKYSGLRNKIILGLSIFCGLRAGEIIRLDYQNVDLANKAIHIINSKYFTSRSIPIESPLLDWLREYFAARDSRINTPALLTSVKPIGNRISRKVINSIYQRIKRQLSIGVNANFLRHHFSSYLFDAGVSVSHLKYLLGHSEEEITSKYIIPNAMSIKAALLNNPLLKACK